jgi:hypothetical protein
MRRVSGLVVLPVVAMLLASGCSSGAAHAQPKAKTTPTVDSCGNGPALDSSGERDAQALRTAQRYDALRRAKAAEKPACRGKSTAAPASSSTISFAEASRRYSKYSAAYLAAVTDLNHAMNPATPPTKAQLRAAIARASRGYDTWLAELSQTKWPPALKPFVDDYLRVAKTSGRQLYSHAKNATSVKDLKRPADMGKAAQISRAETLMASAVN